MLFYCLLTFFPRKMSNILDPDQADVLSVLIWVPNCLKRDEKIRRMQAELLVKYNIGLKTLLQQGISEPIFFGE